MHISKFFNKVQIVMDFSVLLWLAIALSVLIAAYVVAKKLLFSNSSTAIKKDEEEDDYESSSFWKKKNLKTMVLSAKEKIELSWQFLYTITEVVLQKFSAQDQKELEEAAKILVDSGMQYQHVVDYGLPHDVVIVQKADEKITTSTTKKKSHTHKSV